MSRIGKLPISIPNGVKVSVEGNIFTVEGPRGKLNFAFGGGVKVDVDNGCVLVTKIEETQQASANHGTVRATIYNMVEGVTKGWIRKLELNGVGYTASVVSDKLTLKVGFSHDVVMTLPSGIKCSVDKNVIVLESNDKQLVGNFAAKIRKVRPPEPYLGKGVKFVEEVIKRKAGKTAKAK